MTHNELWLIHEAELCFAQNTHRDCLKNKNVHFISYHPSSIAEAPVSSWRLMLALIEGLWNAISGSNFTVVIFDKTFNFDKFIENILFQSIRHQNIFFLSVEFIPRNPTFRLFQHCYVDFAKSLKSFVSYKFSKECLALSLWSKQLLQNENLMRWILLGDGLIEKQQFCKTGLWLCERHTKEILFYLKI